MEGVDEDGEKGPESGEGKSPTKISRKLRSLKGSKISLSKKPNLPVVVEELNEDSQES